ncbi:hypothetical protein C2G38_2066099 [Gigaspora rosea]|uniref:Uncharacterized protein n=1 Tax=Gigaspora rosea TaxID=44941 RepID=A0A397VYD1_9GLOM|nr:hypothetical protein C2G38_2066099 [Gigaspora rosea]
MSSTPSASEVLLGKLQSQVPQYVLGCLPVIAVIGEIPTRGLWSKLQWIFRCLGCPFSGLFYIICVQNDKKAMCSYYLNKEFFARGADSIPFRPFGQHAMKLDPTDSQLRCFSECFSEASVLERLSSLVSAYYILVGLAIAIYKTGTKLECTDWPYVPITLLWTIPVIYKRVVYGRLVFKDVTLEINKLPEDERIIQVVHLNSHELIKKRVLVAITAFLSMVVPWSAVIIAYYTPPKGFFCRSKFLSSFCTIWTFNSFLALILHLRGEVSLKGSQIVHVFFCFCGVVVAMFLLSFCLLSDERHWWVKIFGEDCNNSDWCL